MIEQTAVHQLYPASRLAAMTTHTLNDVAKYVESDAANGTTYSGLTREETIAAAQRSHRDVMGELESRAALENTARAIATEDLREMLPDFERVAALCGISPKRTARNTQIVKDELARRDTIS